MENFTLVAFHSQKAANKFTSVCLTLIVFFSPLLFSFTILLRPSSSLINFLFSNLKWKWCSAVRKWSVEWRCNSSKLCHIECWQSIGSGEHWTICFYWKSSSWCFFNDACMFFCGFYSKKYNINFGLLIQIEVQGTTPIADFDTYLVQSNMIRNNAKATIYFLNGYVPGTHEHFHFAAHANSAGLVSSVVSSNGVGTYVDFYFINYYYSNILLLLIIIIPII